MIAKFKKFSAKSGLQSKVFLLTEFEICLVLLRDLGRSYSIGQGTSLVKLEYALIIIFTVFVGISLQDR